MTKGRQKRPKPTIAEQLTAGEEAVQAGLRIVGVDGGLSYTGLALLVYRYGVGVEVEDLRLIETKKSPKKLRIRQKADDLRRLEEIRDTASMLARTWAPDVVAFEEAPALRSAVTTRKVALAWATVWALFTDRPGIISFEYPIPDIKRIATGNCGASKVQMVEALSNRYVALRDAPVAESKKEHLADAISVGLLACEDPVVVRLAVSLSKLAE